MSGERTLSDALKEKYVESDRYNYKTGLGGEQARDELQHCSIEIRYLARARSVHELNIVTLNSQHIVSVGDTEWLNCHLTSLSEIDLTDNGISDWQQVFILLSTLKALHFLNLTNNPLGRPADVAAMEVSGQSFPQIKTLILNGTQTQWDILNVLLKQLPRLTELHLSKNGYSSVDLQTYHDTLHSLHFNDNAICDPAHLVTLGQSFPYLVTLIAHNLPLTTLIASGEPELLPRTFHQLQCLSLSHSHLSQWDDLHILSLFSSLRKVRVMGIPLFDQIDEEKQRSFLVACLDNVQCLNGSEISSTEREDAERMFVWHFQSVNASERPAAFHKLAEKFGELRPLADICMDPESHVDLIVKFENLPTVRRRYDVTMTTGQLKKQLSSDVVGLPPSKFRLYYVDIETEVVHGHEEMKYMSRKLFSYRMKNNDQIIVQLKGSS